MARLLVLYNQPSDPAAFDQHYFNIHVPIAQKIPGLISYSINKGIIVMPAGGTPTHLVAELDFADMASLQAAMGSPEGQAAAADLPNFAQAGVTLMVFDTQVI